MIDNHWIKDLIAKSKAATLKEAREHDNPLEASLISKVIEKSIALRAAKPEIPLGRLLAAGFDLVVSADYYASAGHKGWFYCPGPSPRLFFHFTNCCPRHALGNVFHFHASSKPESGSIGKSTSRLLRSFLNMLLRVKNSPDFLSSARSKLPRVINLRCSIVEQGSRGDDHHEATGEDTTFVLP